MKAKLARKLFVIIQPLQYLQALELLQENEECILIALLANTDSQLHNLVNEKDWSKVVWLEYSGSFIDVIKKRHQIRLLIGDLGVFDEVVVSSYFNEFMNVMANENPAAKINLLEDGNATLFIDTHKHYKSIKYFIKYIACKLCGFTIRPINNVTMFTLSRPENIKLPSIVSEVVVNDFARLRAETISYTNEKSVYFISSCFINAGMIEKKYYIKFLSQLALRSADISFNIMLHRFDIKEDFRVLEKIENINVIKFEGPIELYFMQKKIKPLKLISSGSGATETLRVIYGFDVAVVMPALESFYAKHRKNVEVLVEHLKESYEVEFLELGE